MCQVNDLQNALWCVRWVDDAEDNLVSFEGLCEYLGVEVEEALSLLESYFMCGIFIENDTICSDLGVLVWDD